MLIILWSFKLDIIYNPPQTKLFCFFIRQSVCPYALSQLLLNKWTGTDETTLNDCSVWYEDVREGVLPW